MLKISRQIADTMVAHANEGLPNEACGLFAGKLIDAQDVEVLKFFPMANAAESVEIYQLDPKEQMAVEKEANENGLDILGIMHSHTYTPAYPSPTDVEDASNFDPFGGWHYILVSLQHETPDVRSYRIIDREITEEEVQLS